MTAFLRRVWPLLTTGARRRFIAFALASVAVAVLEAVAVGLVVPLTSLLTSSDDGGRVVGGFVGRLFDFSSREQAAAVLGAGAVGLFIAKGVAAVALLRWAVDHSLRQEARIARRLFDRYLRAPATYHLSHNSGEIQRTINESLPLVFRRTLPFILGSAADAFTLLAVVAVILVNDPVVAMLAVGYFVMIGVVYQRYISGRQKAAARRAHKEVATRYRQVQEALGAATEIAILNRHRFFVDRFFRTKLELVDAQRTLVFYQLMPRYFLDLAFVLGGALMAAYAFATAGVDDGLTIVGLFLAASARLVAPLNRITSTITLARSAGPSLDQVIDDLAELDAVAVVGRDGSGERLGPVALVLRDVSFRYTAGDGQVLAGISLAIAPGDDVGIVGSTGAGKTTLLRILLGLFEPTGGAVEVGGRPLEECRSQWQRSIGYVPQDVLLSDDTLRGNVAFGIEADQVDEAAVARAVATAQLEDFVASLPAGLDTPVGENGVRLSGGQRQRLGLARALYHDPAVLVLDEATSALDSETEARITETIATLRGQLTVITVSHRLSTLKHCDRIYFLRSGAIASVGTFDELRASEPEFAQLVSRAQLPGGPPGAS